MQKYTLDIIMSIISIIVAFIATIAFELDLIFTYGIALIIIVTYNGYSIYKNKNYNRINRFINKMGIGAIYLVITLISFVLYQTNTIEESLSNDGLILILIFSILYITVNLYLYKRKSVL